MGTTHPPACSITDSQGPDPLWNTPCCSQPSVKAHQPQSPHRQQETAPPSSPTARKPLPFLAFLVLEVLQELSLGHQISPLPLAERDAQFRGAQGSEAPGAGGCCSCALLLLLKALSALGYTQLPVLTRFLFAALQAGCRKGPSGGSPAPQAPQIPKKLCKGTTGITGNHSRHPHPFLACSGLEGVWGRGKAAKK